MHVGNTGLDESLRLLRVLALAECVASISQTNGEVDEAFGHTVEVDEEPSGICIDVQSLI